MGILNDDDELLAKLRAETATSMPERANAALADSTTTPSVQEQLQAAQQAQQGLPSAGALAPKPAVADIIRKAREQQTAEQAPSRLDSLVSALKSGGSAIASGFGKVNQALSAGPDADGYDRMGQALYALGTGQKLPPSFFQKPKGPDKEMVALEKELRRAQILKALRGEPVKPVEAGADKKSPLSVSTQDAYIEMAKKHGILTPTLEAAIRESPADDLNKGSSPVAQYLRARFSEESGNRGQQHVIISQEGAGRAERKFTHEQFKGFAKDVEDFNNKFDKNNMQLQIDAAREADKLLGGALSSGEDVPLPSTVDAFDLPHKVDARLKFLPSLALKKLQGEYEAEKARNPNAKTADITKKLMSRPEYAREIEQLQISSSLIDNILTNKLYGSALSEQEAARARAMLGTEWGQTPAGRVYALRLVTRAMDKALKRQSGSLKVYAAETGMEPIYDNYVRNGAIIEGVWDSKPQPAAKEEKPRVSPLDRPSNPADKGPQVPVPEGMPEVTTQVSEPTPAQLDELASGNKKQIIRVKPKAPAARAARPQEGEEFTVKGQPGTYKMVNGKPVKVQ